ncbi:MAG: glycosyltransferase [Pseudomonadota bacterium]
MSQKISAIVPTYNRAAFVVEAVGSLMAQTRPVQEIVIWDDGSTDGTEAALRPLAEGSMGVVRYFRTENGGKSRALNAALHEVTGDYIWVFDDDDVALPHAAEALAGALDGSRAGLVGARHERFSDGPDGRLLDGTGYWPDLSSGSVLRHMLEDIFFFQPASLVRRDLFDRVGPFREDLPRSIDYEMFVRLAARAPVEMVDQVVFHQRKHDGARGPAAARHAAQSSEAVWLENDRRIFRDFRDVLPLSLYEAMFNGPAAPRAALLQRGCVYARRADWDLALEDFRAALRLDVGPLTPTERSICLRAMAAKHGCDEALTAPVRGELMALKSAGPVGRQIVAGFGRGLLWRLREAISAREAGRALRLASFIAAAGTRAQGLGAEDALTENDVLSEEAYAW